MLTRSTLALLSICLFAGCATTGGAGGASASADLDSYLPLAVGNSWTYSTFFQGQAQAEMLVQLTGQDGPFFVDNQPKPSRYVYDADGLRDGSKRYLLKAPIVKGTKWMSVADIKTVERYEIIDVERKVRVPAGVFPGCVVVQMEVRMDEKRAMYNQVTYAPGVGIVEVRTMLKDGAKLLPQSHLVLKKYEIKTNHK